MFVPKVCEGESDGKHRQIFGKLGVAGRLTKQTRSKDMSSTSKTELHDGPDGELTVGHCTNDVAQSSIVVDDLPLDGDVVLDEHTGGLDTGSDDGDETGDGDAGDRDDGHDRQLAKMSLEGQLPDFKGNVM
jgi:hypothetical protein